MSDLRRDPALNPTVLTYELGLHAGAALTVEVSQAFGLEEGAAATRTHLANALPDVERAILWDAVQRIVKLRTAPDDASALPDPSEAVSGCHRPGCGVCAASLARTRPRASASARPHNARATAPADEHEHEVAVVSLVLGADPAANFREFLDNLSEDQEHAMSAWMLGNLGELARLLTSRLAEMDREAA